MKLEIKTSMAIFDKLDSDREEDGRDKWVSVESLIAYLKEKSKDCVYYSDVIEMLQKELSK